MRLLHTKDFDKPLYRDSGGFKYRIWRLKLWWNTTSTEGKYEGFVVIGMTIQVSDIPQVKFIKIRNYAADAAI